MSVTEPTIYLVMQGGPGLPKNFFFGVRGRPPGPLPWICHCNVNVCKSGGEVVAIGLNE